MKLYVAVVCRKDGTSYRTLGDWASFIDSKKDVAVEKALKAATKWSAQGPYNVLVGTLTTEAKPVAQYDLVPLKTGGK